MNSYMQRDDIAASIIATVSNLIYAGNIYINYMQQDLRKKELILVHNNSSDDFEQWVFLSRLYPMVRVYQQDNGTSIGGCLNYCIERSIFENIVLFHEAHYYGPGYLSGSLREWNHTPADLFGKKTYFALQENTNRQALNNPGYENCCTDFVILPTFIFKQTLFNIVRFKDSDTNLDNQFCKDCRDKNCKIFSTDRNNYLLRY